MARQPRRLPNPPAAGLGKCRARGAAEGSPPRRGGSSCRAPAKHGSPGAPGAGVGPTANQEREEERACSI